jgi:hypothetical protein
MSINEHDILQEQLVKVCPVGSVMQNRSCLSNTQKTLIPGLATVASLALLRA